LIPAGTRIAFAAPTSPYERYDPDANVWRVQGSVAPISSDHDAAAETRASSVPAPSVRWRFGPNVNVSTSGDQVWPDIIRFGVGNLCASWMDDRTGTYKIYSSVSTDGGKTWLADQRVDDSPPGVHARFVTLAPYGASDLVAVWEDKRSSPTWNVYLSRGTWNAGKNRIRWSSSTQINTTGGATNPIDFDYMHPSVATDDGNVYVAWSDWREGVYYQVYSRASTDGGLTWKPEVRISDEIGDQPISGDPSLVVDYGSSAVPRPVAVAWNEWRGYGPGQPDGSYPDVSFARSTDGGQTWTNPTVRVNDITDFYQQASKRVVAITPLTHTINVGWWNWPGGPMQMRVSRSTDNGATWLASKLVNSPQTDTDTSVCLAAGFGEDIHAHLQWNP